ncbi:MAG TPA: TRAP transporter substrate-binding protein [Burkholderiaceae bacterium]|nr:TRAP transporter substrate-binding protein [Burkholderiaceae bacterium]
MQRRKFVSTLAASGAAVGAAPAAVAQSQVRWRLASSYPKALDTVYGGAEMLSDRVSRLTDGRFRITAHAAGELSPPLQVLDAVQAGSVECCHTNSYYFVGKNMAFGFETALPFGLNTRQQNAWIYHGGGMELLREFYRDFNVMNFPGGNTGAQMGGWFREPIKGLADVKGLKIRIPGIGGQVWARMGAVPQNIPGGDIYPSLERGVIDAAEWIGPYDDEKLGFYKIAKHYFTPGWWEPSSQFSFFVNAAEFAKLPKPFQEAFEVAAAEVNLNMMAEYDAKNPLALRRLVGAGVTLHRYPVDLMRAAQKTAFEFYDEEAAKNPAFRKIYTAWRKARDDAQTWFSVAEQSYDAFASANRG